MTNRYVIRDVTPSGGFKGTGKNLWKVGDYLGDAPREFELPQVDIPEISVLSTNICIQN